MLVRMSITPNVRDLLDGHISLELESIDRLYLIGYVAQLQHGAGLVGFLRQQRGQPIASPALLAQITGKFVAEQARQPELRLERRAHPTGGAADRDPGRSTSAGL